MAIGIRRSYSIDLGQNSNYLIVQFPQGDGDNTRYIDITLLNNGLPYTFDTKKYVPRIEGTKPNGDVYINFCDVSIDSTTGQAVIHVQIFSELTAVEGKGTYSIALVDNDLNRLSSFPFYIYIYPATYNPRSVIGSPVFTELDALLKMAEQQKASLNGALQDAKNATDAANEAAKFAYLQTGNGAPTDTTKKEGTVYIDFDTMNIYRLNSAKTWINVGNLKTIRKSTAITDDGRVATTGTGADLLTEKYNVHFTDGTQWEFRVKDGRGIFKIEQVGGTDPVTLKDRYVVTYDDNTTFDYYITNGRGINKVDITTESIYRNSIGGIYNKSDYENEVTIDYNDGTYDTITVYDGVGTYTHIKYAQDGIGTNMSSVPSSVLQFMGVYTGPSQTPPTNASDYTWSKYVASTVSTGMDIDNYHFEYSSANEELIVPLSMFTDSTGNIFIS